MVKVFTVAAGQDSVETEERGCVPGIFSAPSVSRLTNKNLSLTMILLLVFFLVNQSALISAFLASFHTILRGSTPLHSIKLPITSI